MRNKKLKLSAIFLLCLGLTALKAQENISAGGGNGSGIGGSVSYSVGQIVYTTIKGTNSFIVQGVQQPYEISVISGIGITEGITLQYTVYPNPTTDILTLKIDGNSYIQYVVYLYNTNGNLLQSIKSESSEVRISMGRLSPGIYYLKVYTSVVNPLTGLALDFKEVKTFKIIKN